MALKPRSLGAKPMKPLASLPEFGAEPDVNARVEACPRCGEVTDKLVTCPGCGEGLCVENCVPAGMGALCTECDNS